jgi:hypothetical protein
MGITRNPKNHLRSVTFANTYKLNKTALTKTAVTLGNVSLLINIFIHFNNLIYIYLYVGAGIA